jgi:hypothetical protein
VGKNARRFTFGAPPRSSGNADPAGVIRQCRAATTGNHTTRLLTLRATQQRSPRVGGDLRSDGSSFSPQNRPERKLRQTPKEPRWATEMPLRRLRFSSPVHCRQLDDCAFPKREAPQLPQPRLAPGCPDSVTPECHRKAPEKPGPQPWGGGKGVGQALRWFSTQRLTTATVARPLLRPSQGGPDRWAPST